MSAADQFAAARPNLDRQSPQSMKRESTGALLPGNEDRKGRGLTIVELNEFNFPLLERAANELKLTNLQALLRLPKASLWTDDTYACGLLEPWVQWVSIHTGQPASQHRIQHLGDVPDL